MLDNNILMLTKKYINCWNVGFVPCCHDLNSTVLVLDLWDILEDEIPNMMTKTGIQIYVVINFSLNFSFVTCNLALNHLL